MCTYSRKDQSQCTLLRTKVIRSVLRATPVRAKYVENKWMLILSINLYIFSVQKIGKMSKLYLKVEIG